jgi:murein DD-endopeptidase MepM/ murein hydrolase activator NlpD
MKNLSFPISGEGEHPTKAAACPSPCPLILRCAAWCMVAVWRMGVDWSTKRPFLIRVTAHLSVIVLTLVAIGLSGVGLPTPQAAVGTSSDARASSLKMRAASDLEPTPPLPPTLPANQFHTSDINTVARLSVPHTDIPDRLRAEVITYVVQPGDTIFDVAARFGLSPETVVWSNREILQDAPWLIQLGLELFILPVDGIYHIVRADDTIASIAAEYDVEPATLYNEWNGLEEEDPIHEGQMLIVPGGKGEEVAWTPPQPEYATSGSAQYSYGVCSGATFTGPGANGWFILPTGSSRVSGWYFHDVRNPTHIGLDYACNRGDPIYAADNGVVTIAGWNGGYGILVEINHGNGFVTRYGHFTDIVVGCGQPLYQGQLLGYCGSTGWSSGPHLHFETRYNGIPQDPQAYLP